MDTNLLGVVIGGLIGLAGSVVPHLWVKRRAPACHRGTALGRIEIPQDAVERISELLTPGSSLIISDYGLSSETGPYTNFIVLTH